ncbi:hypothetical protein K1718_12390 [Roseibium porphyridii]|uniref:DUF3551 domain-containing protein n=1 Tax=Roseibium porphyridii TaxID=2866279 RepID=A0ABY8F9F1_9HYPH|nr:hypothetical protein [Roseibium sp. KMA01]QFT31535.1 hypothetical protein FIV00_13655 [Labrenzia sp. THAF82]WFE92125.1 hypothetical protein K1718_12390 [Roseibium sp. KMA01]
MALKNTYSIALIVSATIIIAALFPKYTEESDWSSLDQCYNNYKNCCNQEQSQRPEFCTLHG